MAKIRRYARFYQRRRKYAIQILKANRSKVVANDKDKATTEENVR